MLATVPPAWQTYADELAKLGYGLALWEPAPLHNYDKVAIGDVGYIREGCFHLLFSAAMPPGDRVAGLNVPRSFEPIDPGPTFYKQPRAPGALHTGNIDQKGASFGASSDISFIQAGTSISFESSSRTGAILLTKFKTYREDVESLGFLKDYMARNYQSWLDYANQHGHMVNLDDILLVTGHDMTRDFAMLAFSSNYRQIGMEFEACLPAVASASASVWGTWRTTMSVHHNCGPQLREPPSHHSGALMDQEDVIMDESRSEYNQCVFLRGFRIRRKAGLFPKVIKAAAGPHDLGSGHRFDDDGPLVLSEESEGSEVEIVALSDTPSFVDPLDPVFRYIFENSSADMAMLHDVDLLNLMEVTDTFTSEDINILVSRLNPDMIELRPDGIACINLTNSPPPTPSPYDSILLSDSSSGPVMRSSESRSPTSAVSSAPLNPRASPNLSPIDDPELSEPSSGSEHLIFLNSLHSPIGVPASPSHLGDRRVIPSDRRGDEILDGWSMELIAEEGADGTGMTGVVSVASNPLWDSTNALDAVSSEKTTGGNGELSAKTRDELEAELIHSRNRIRELEFFNDIYRRRIEGLENADYGAPIQNGLGLFASELPPLGTEYISPPDWPARTAARLNRFCAPNRAGNAFCAWHDSRRERRAFPPRQAPPNMLNCGCTYDEALFEESLARNHVGALFPNGTVRLDPALRNPLLKLLERRYGYRDGDFERQSDGSWKEGEDAQSWQQRVSSGKGRVIPENKAFRSEPEPPLRLLRKSPVPHTPKAGNAFQT